jgi:hypothetical protein
MGQVSWDQISVLLESLEHSSAYVQAAALNALVRLPLDRGQWFNVADFVNEKLHSPVKSDPSGGRTLGGMPMYDLIEAASFVPVRSVRRTLYHLMDSEDKYVSRTIAEKLAVARDPQAVGHLLEDLSENYDAAENLALLDVTDRVKDVMKAYRRSTDPDVRLWLAVALARTGDSGPLKRILKELNKGKLELKSLWGDPFYFSDKLRARGQMPEGVREFLSKFADDLSNEEAARNIAGDLYLGGTKPEEELEPVEPEDIPEDKELEELARKVEDQIEKRSESDQPLDEHLLRPELIPYLRPSVSPIFVNTMYEKAIEQGPAAFLMGNEITQEIFRIRHKFTPDIDSLYQMSLQGWKKGEEIPLAHVAWTVSRVGLDKVLERLNTSLGSHDEKEREFAAIFLQSVLKYVYTDPYPPQFGGVSDAPDLVPHTSELIDDYEVAMGPSDNGGESDMDDLIDEEDTAISPRVERGIGMRGNGGEPEPDKETPDRTYANIDLWELDRQRKLQRDRAIPPEHRFYVEVDIGKVKKGIIEDAQPLPRNLPDYLDVMVSSTDFLLAPADDEAQLGQETTLDGRLNKQDKGFWTTDVDGGDPYLRFLLQAPGQPLKAARVRVNYYFRKHLVQSHLITADVGGGRGEIKGETDFSVSEQLYNLTILPERTRQFSILVNQSDTLTNDVVIRIDDEVTEELVRKAFSLNKEEIDKIISRIRKKLDVEATAPKKMKRTKRQLKEDLIQMAPRGHYLKALVINPIGRDVYPSLRDYRKAVVQVVRPTTSSYAFPWNFMYEYYVEYKQRSDQVVRRNYRFCKCVEEWDEESPLYPEGTDTCEHESADNTNLLCPLGFWGYRYPIEQKSKEREPITDIPTSPKFEMVVARTNKDLRKATKDRLKVHFKEIQGLIEEKITDRQLSIVESKADLKTHLGKEDLALVYFYCHGKRIGDEIFLSIGDDEEIPPVEFQSWVNNWLIYDNKTVWNEVRPLIFINACRSLDMRLSAPIDYLDAFISTAHAAGVIGTEVSVDQGLAIDFAKLFFESLFAGMDVGDALHETRMAFLRQGNIFGLVYTPYCMVDLSLKLD